MKVVLKLTLRLLVHTALKGGSDSLASRVVNLGHIKHKHNYVKRYASFPFLMQLFGFLSLTSYLTLYGSILKIATNHVFAEIIEELLTTDSLL